MSRAVLVPREESSGRQDEDSDAYSVLETGIGDRFVRMEVNREPMAIIGWRPSLLGEAIPIRLEAMAENPWFWTTGD